MYKRLLLTIFVFLVGGVAGWALTSFVFTETTDGTGHQVRQGGYLFINPLLECEVEQGVDTKHLRSFKSKVEKQIAEETANDSTSHISVYYRDLNNGPWFGIDEDEGFAPQSLLKVPLMMAYLKLAESDSDILYETIVYSSKGEDQSQQVHLFTDGEAYPILNFIEAMIVESDNDAFRTLVNHIDYNIVQQVHVDLGIALPGEDIPDDFISVKTYASLFRVLYNSSYLSREMSEEALAILSRATFVDGLVAGVPEETIVSHKYGVRGSAQSSERQLHDCGIIYAQNPYLLCVMTRGSDFGSLSGAIQRISSIVYGEVSP